MDHLAGWRLKSARFCDLLEGTDPLINVPGCPGWRLEDLAFHVGNALDWFAQIAGNRLTQTDQVRELVLIDRPESGTSWPAWVRERVAVLDDVLANLGSDEPVWNPTRRNMTGSWILRRMHHELVMHLHDLEDALGDPTPIDSDVAADGVAEFMESLAHAGQKWPGEDPATLKVVQRSPVPVRTWRLRLESGERAKPAEVSSPADVKIEGDASTLLLALWQRRPLAIVEFAGDARIARAILDAIGR